MFTPKYVSKFKFESQFGNMKFTKDEFAMEGELSQLLVVSIWFNGEKQMHIQILGGGMFTGWTIGVPRKWPGKQEITEMCGNWRRKAEEEEEEKME